MQDRVPVNPGRVLVTPENGGEAYYATLTRADNPTQEGTALNKATLLKDATAALFGLGADAVPNDVLAFLGRYNCHWWSVLHGEAHSEVQEVLTPITSDIQLTYEGGIAKIKYSKEISIESSTLAVSLVNPKTLTFYNESKTEVAAALAKLISMAPVYITESVLNADTIFYIPAGATNGTSNARTIYYSTEDDGYVTWLSATASVHASIVGGEIVNIQAGETTYVNSNDRNAYPDSGTVDGLTYKYLGIPLQNAVTAPKIATGSYTGTGTYGSSNPNSLTFDFKPKFLVVFEVITASKITDGIVAMMVTGSPCYWTSDAQMGLQGSNNVSWAENTVSWFNNINQTNGWDVSNCIKFQLNISGATYRYIAIG